MYITGDEVADVVLKQYAALPSKRKPSQRANGDIEWTILCGIVAQGSIPGFIG